VGATVISSISATDSDPSDVGYLNFAISQENRFAVSITLAYVTHTCMHTR